jgi:hypothetical protein
MAAHNLNDRQRSARTLRFELEAKRERGKYEAQDRERALEAVMSFNSWLGGERRLLSIPTVEAAILSGYRWMQVTCQGCGQRAAIDLTFRNPPPNTPVNYFLANGAARFVQVRIHGRKSISFGKIRGRDAIAATRII